MSAASKGQLGGVIEASQGVKAVESLGEGLEMGSARCEWTPSLTTLGDG